MTQQTLREAVEQALEFYADEKRYHGANQVLDGPDKYTPENFSYLMDVTRDRGSIATAALALARAEQAHSKAMVLVPKRMTKAMREVTDQDDWDWPDLLAAAEAITEEEYLAICSGIETAMPEQTRAASDVLAERQRQISVEGWTPEHDDKHSFGELARASAAYAAQSLCAEDAELDCGPTRWWPWDRSWWNPSGRRSMLVKAGALILAEIERLDRAAGQATEGKETS